MAVRSPLSLLSAVAVLAALAPAALAHPSLDLKSANPGSIRAALRVPHGCDGSSTVAVRLTIPEGIIGVKPAPKPGWTVATTKGPYAKSYDYFHGKKVSEGVKEIVWRGGPLLDEHFDEFLFTGFVTRSFADGDEVAFPVTQDCEKGQLAWTEIAASGVDRHSLKMPAPVLKISVQDVGEKAASAERITVGKAWARATPGGAKVGAAYLEIVNSAAAADRLISLSAPVAARTEIHEMSHDNGVMKMRALSDGLEVPPGATISLAPGGIHVMFVDLAVPLTAGQTFELSLNFQNAGTLTVPVTVGEVGSEKPAEPQSHHH